MVDAITHMLREAGKLEKAGREHGWEVKTTQNTNGRDGTATVIIVECVATRGQEVISIWWENKRLLEAPKYVLAGREIKLRNASACVQQMAKKPDFEKAARKARTKRQCGEDSLDLGPAPETLPWVFLRDPENPMYVPPEDSIDSDILRICYAKTVVYKNNTTGEVLTDVIVRSSDASRRLGNFNSNTYNISRSSSGREILNFLGVFGFRSIALDCILRIGSSEEAAERERKHLLEIARAEEKDKADAYKKVIKKHE